MTTTAYAWAPITKVEDQPDGTVMVYGPATDAGVDRDKQRLNQDWLDTAMPQWMAEGGNVREQHDAKRAVGVAAGLTRGADGAHNLAARVVDPVAVTKVRAGVLKGFSVGIKDPQINFGKADAPNGEVVGGSIIEVSLVDRPSNPRTLFTMVKADAAGDLEDVDGAEVEESDVAAQAQAVLDEVKLLIPALTATTKADAATDVATAQEAINCIGQLIASEAEQLAAGDLDEAGDIACLLDAVRALKYFITRETAEPAGDALASSASMNGDTYMADAVDKADTTTPPAEPAVTPPADAPDLTKVDSPDVAAIVKTAVAEAMKTLTDELTLVKADLAKVAAMPVPGGPVAMRTASQTLAARDADAIALRTQANAYLSKAEELRNEDPTAAAGYRELARETMAKADGSPFR